jgi:hypothetical protein
MTTGIALGPDDLRIIGHSINWELNVPYDHSPPPRLSEQEAAALNGLFTDLCRLNRHCLAGGVDSVLVEVADPYSVSDDRIRLPALYLTLMTEAVASFLREVGHSSTELEVVTGLPWSKTPELLARLQGVLHEVCGGEATDVGQSPRSSPS